MGSSFFELNIATSGLFAAKAGIQIASNNVANAATIGYSRQYAMQKATTPLNNFNGVGQVGTGTVVYGIGQHRDVFLDKKYWVQNSTYGEYTQKAGQLNIIESIFNPLQTTGLTGTTNKFFDTISNLEFSANDLDYRTDVINNADSLAQDIRAYAASLSQQQRDVNEDIYAIVQRINTIGAEIASINQQIYTYEISGNKANELRDQRTVLLDELSTYVNIETKEVPDGTGRELGVKFTVLVSGQEFVNNSHINKLECVPRQNAIHENDSPNLYNIVWSNGQDLNLNGLTGELKGLIDIRDGDSKTGGGTEYKGIPYYMEKLNEFVRTIAKAFNEGKKMDDTPLEGVIGHVNGFDLNGDAGGVFFTMTLDDGTTATTIDDYSKINAFNFSVSDELKKNPAKLAASDTNDPTQESNNKVILGFTKLKEDVSLFNEGSVHQFTNALASVLGIDKSQADKFSEYYEDMATTIDNQRLQVYGVSLNEEVASIVKYQQIYKVSAKLMNVINEIYDTTINGLGV